MTTVLAPYSCASNLLSWKALNIAWKRYSDEDVLKLLREIDVHMHDGLNVVSACRKAGISDEGAVRQIGSSIRSLESVNSMRR